MHTRRSFLKDFTLSAVLVNWSTRLDIFKRKTQSSSTIDWEMVRGQFPISTWEKTHFNSGSAGVMPTPISEYLIDLIQYVNSKAPYQVWNEWQVIKKDNMERLSKLIHCDPNSLQIVRNTTEALNMIIYGLPLSQGDEVILCEHDYPFAKNAWLNRQTRDRIKLKIIEYDLPASDEEVLTAYANAIGPSTKVIHITHMTHRQGHIMPVQQIVELAHEKGIEVVVDGAHAVGQIHVDLRKIGCDYFASSLHKWLNAPLGTGLLYIHPDKISSLMNHPSSNVDTFDRIDKYEHLGTRCWANEICIGAALDLHEEIGPQFKLDRLQELKRYWTSQVERIPNVTLYTLIDNQHSAAVATFGITNMGGGKIVKRLDQEFNIHAKSVGGRWGSGVRISVNIFTSKEELDTLVKAIKYIAAA